MINRESDEVRNVVVELPKFEFSDDLLLKQFQQQIVEPEKVTVKPPIIPKKVSTKQAAPFKHLYDVETERMIMGMEEKTSLEYEIALHRQRFDQKNQVPPTLPQMLQCRYGPLIYCQL